MSHDVGHQLAGLMSLGYATTVALAPQVPMSDAQVVGVSIGAGLMGGLVSALMADGDLTRRMIATRVLACGMIAPAIVAVGILYVVPAPTLMLVVALAGIAGIAAWPMAQVVPKLAPSLLRDGIKRWLGGRDGS